MGGAGSFSASPSANPAGRRKRVRRCGARPCARSHGGGLPGRRRRLGLAAQSPAPAPTPAPAPRRRRPSHRRRRLRRRLPADGPRPRRPDRPTASPTRPTRRPPPSSRRSGRPTRSSGMPYRLGGGHKLGFTDHAYDCSGTVSFALHGGNLLARPRDSSSFMRYGVAGKGRWITVYTNPGHAFVVIAGLRLDTSAAGDPAGRLGPALAPEPALDERLPGAPPHRAVASGAPMSALWLFLPSSGRRCCTRPSCAGTSCRRSAPARRRPLAGRPADLRRQQDLARRAVHDDRRRPGHLGALALGLVARPAARRRARASPLLVGLLIGLGMVSASCPTRSSSAAWTSRRARAGVRSAAWRSRCSTRATSSWASGSPAADMGHARVAGGDRLRRHRGRARGVNVVGYAVGARTAPV